MTVIVNKELQGDELKALHSEILKNLRTVMKEERETTIAMYEDDEWAGMYTSSPRKIREMFRKQMQHPEHIRIRFYDEYGVQFDFITSMLKMVALAERRELSSEERAERAELRTVMSNSEPLYRL